LLSKRRPSEWLLHGGGGFGPLLYHSSGLETLERAEQYVCCVSADADARQKILELLDSYEQDAEEYQAGVARIADLLDAWNRENLGHIKVDERAQAFIARMRARTVGFLRETSIIKESQQLLNRLHVLSAGACAMSGSGAAIQSGRVESAVHFNFFGPQTIPSMSVLSLVRC